MPLSSCHLHWLATVRAEWPHETKSLCCASLASWREASCECATFLILFVSNKCLIWNAIDKGIWTNGWAPCSDGATVLDVPINPPRWDVLHLTFNRMLPQSQRRKKICFGICKKIPKNVPGLFDNVADVDCPGLHAQWSIYLTYSAKNATYLKPPAR